MINKILPLLNRLVPPAMAFKGLQKIDPRIGKFLTNSVSYGYGLDQSLDYLRNRFSPEEEPRTGNLNPQEKAGKRIVEQSQLPGKVAKNAAQLGIAAGVGTGAIPMVLGNLFADDDEKEAQISSKNNSPQNPLQALSQFSPELAEFMDKHMQTGRSPQEAAAVAYQIPQFKSIIDKIYKKTNKNFIDLVNELFGSQTQSAQSSPQQMQPESSQRQPGPGQQALLQAIQQLRQLKGSK